MGLYRGPFQVNSKSVFPISFRAMDRAGNQEALKSMTLRVDGAGPETTLTVNGVPRAEATLDVDGGDLIALEAVDPGPTERGGEPVTVVTLGRDHVVAKSTGRG